MAVIRQMMASVDPVAGGELAVAIEYDDTVPTAPALLRIGGTNSTAQRGLIQITKGAQVRTFRPAAGTPWTFLDVAALGITATVATDPKFGTVLIVWPFTVVCGLGG